MLTYVRRNKVSNIIVYSIDRFSRAGASAIAIVEELKKKRINVLSVTQPVNTESSTGTFFQNINLLFSKYDNDQRREKTITGMRQRLLNGYWLGTAPFGYKNARSEDNIPIIIKSEKAKWVKKAFDWKVNENLSNVEICERFKLHGIKIYKQRLTDIFKNPIYCGYIASSLLEGQIIKGKHKPIVSEELFLQVNGIKVRNTSGYKQNKSNENLPLKGFMRCAKCESPLTGFIVKKKNIYYYKCKTKGCSCTKNSNKLHDKFKSLLGNYQIDFKLLASLKLQLKNVFEYHNKPNQDLTASLKYNLKSVNEKIEKVEERFVYGEIDITLYNKYVKKLSIEKGEIENEIRKGDFESSNLENYLDKAIHLISNLNNMWELSDYNTKQKLQKLLFPSGMAYNKESDKVQTFEVNSVLSLIGCLSMSFVDEKSGQLEEKSNLSALVTSAGFKPATS